MKTRQTLPVVFSSALLLTGSVVAAQGCYAPDFVIDRCGADPLGPSEACPENGDSSADAGGTDGGTDAEADVPEPNCPGLCVPFPESADAALWSKWPDLVWIGPLSERPEACPDDSNTAGKDLAMQFLLYSELDAPPAVCDICECEKSEGECTELTTDITIRAGTCDNVIASTIPFGDPQGWDGSCTNADALPVDEKCPVGSSTLCAQSVAVGKLPGPTTESCAVTTHPVPNFTTSKDWKTGVISCRGNVNETACGEGSACVRDLPLPWLQCIWRAGKHQVCPLEYDWDRFWTYPETAIIDDRKCTKCECGAPVGSACVGTLRLYDDATCTSQSSQIDVASYGDQCTNLYPPGKAIGAKAIPDLHYIPGECLASGGGATGSAKEDDSQAITFCCRAPFAW